MKLPPGKSWLVLLCAAVLGFAGYSRWRAGRLVPVRLVVLQIRWADSLMERWADEPQGHAVVAHWLDSTAKLQRYRAYNAALPPPPRLTRDASFSMATR